MHREISKESNFKTKTVEKGFKLPLKTIISGINSSGKIFQEPTKLTYISHIGSSFWMRTPVVIGTELRLTVDLPENLSKSNDLKLVIRGKIVFIELSKEDQKKQRVSIKFDSKYFINPAGKD